MKPTLSHTHLTHPARKAARANARLAERIAPGFDFSEPAAPLAAGGFEQVVAELEREFPRQPDAPELPIAQYSYTPESYLSELLRAEAARVLLLTKLHSRYVRYDKERPDLYADECYLTWSVPHLTQLALADATPEARFIAQEIFRTVDWSRPWHIQPLTDEGCDKISAFVASVARRIAPFVTPGNSDLFGQ